MRPIFDIKAQGICKTQDACSPNVTAVSESIKDDHFSISRQSAAKLTPRFNQGPVWWLDLQPLIDALPCVTFAVREELSEESKEALRELARSAPHRHVVSP